LPTPEDVDNKDSHVRQSFVVSTKAKRCPFSCQVVKASRRQEIQKKHPIHVCRSFFQDLSSQVDPKVVDERASLFCMTLDVLSPVLGLLECLKKEMLFATFCPKKDIKRTMEARLFTTSLSFSSEQDSDRFNFFGIYP
jgi:hypothetical protein